MDDNNMTQFEKTEARFEKIETSLCKKSEEALSQRQHGRKNFEIGKRSSECNDGISTGNYSQRPG
jgi:hypothetical protein